MTVNIYSSSLCGRMPMSPIQAMESGGLAAAAAAGAAAHSIHRPAAHISCKSSNSSGISSNSTGDGALRFHPLFNQPQFHRSPIHIAFHSSDPDQSGSNSGGEEPIRSLAPLSNPFQPLSKDVAMGLVFQAASGKGWTTGSGLEGPAFPDLTGVDSDEGKQQKWPQLSKSPRRRMRVAFTCNVCGARTMRAINPHAYTDGTVFVQCKGCNVFHKLVDNLNLFFEWDGRLYKTMKSIPPTGKFYKLMQTDGDVETDDGHSSWPM